MGVEVIGIDHIYITVTDLQKAQQFYDQVMNILGFLKVEKPIGGDPHIHYYNRQFGYSLRPSRSSTSHHDPYSPGLHHFCFRVSDEAAVDRAAQELRSAGIKISDPQYYPQYGDDYYAIFFSDQDGIRLEIVNFRERRRKLMFDWENEKPG